MSDEKVVAILVLSISRSLDGPGEGVDEGHNEVDEGPADDDVVVGHNAEGGQHRGESDTRKSGVDSTEDTDVTALELLSERHLHEGDRDSNEEEAAQVRDEEQSTTPSVAQVGEAPEVAEADTVADHSQDEGGVAQPTRSLGVSLIFEEFDAAVFAAHRFF